MGLGEDHWGISSPLEQWGTEQNVSVVLGPVRGEGWQMLSSLREGPAGGGLQDTLRALACAPALGSPSSCFVV